MCLWCKENDSHVFGQKWRAIFFVGIAQELLKEQKQKAIFNGLYSSTNSKRDCFHSSSSTQETRYTNEWIYSIRTVHQFKMSYRHASTLSLIWSEWLNEILIVLPRRRFVEWSYHFSEGIYALYKHRVNPKSEKSTKIQRRDQNFFPVNVSHLCNIEHHRHCKIEVRIGTSSVNPQIPGYRCHQSGDENHANNNQTMSNIFNEENQPNSAWQCFLTNLHRKR